MIVLKFGGTSVGTIEKVRDSASIIEQQPMPRAAVVSAASGVTNMLLESASHAAAGDSEAVATLVETIVAKHHSIANGIENIEQRSGALAELDQLHAALRESLAVVASAGN